MIELSVIEIILIAPYGRSFAAKCNECHLYGGLLIATKMSPWGLGGQNSKISEFCQS